jgi:DNA-binding transcriptional ArsR family regulator
VQAYGQSVIYQLVVLLDDGGPLTPSKLAKATGRQISTLSSHLAKLRALDVVRYNTAGKETRYWLKHRGEMKGFLKTMEKIVEATAHMD